MPCPRPSDQEIAIYVARMLDELVKLSRPLDDHFLECLLTMSASVAWCHGVKADAQGRPPRRH